MRKQRILQSLSRLEEDRRLLFAQVGLLDPSRLVARAGENKWSVLEILHHMYLSEAGTHRYINKKLQFSPNGLPPSLLGSRIKTIFLEGVLNSPLRIKAPAGLDAFPEELELKKIEQEWSLVRLDFRKLIEQLSEDQLKWLLFKHPFVGRINMIDTVRFIEAHYQHHKRQIQRLIS